MRISRQAMRRALSLVALAPGVAGAQSALPSARLDSVFAGQAGTDHPGCAVSVVDRGTLVAARGYGMADLAQSLAITPKSIFHVASVSKQFTAMSIVLLARAGKLSLDDDIRKHLPEMPAYQAPVTIRQMLEHTAGIRDQWSLLISAGWRLGDDLITEQDVMEIVPRQRSLNFAPGTDWLYSNSGFTLAAVIVKRVTGQSLRAFADSALFKPLGMTSTHFHDDNLEIVPGRTRGYTRRAGTWKETVPNYSTVGATSLFTTVEDLAKWHGQLARGIVGGTGAIEELTRRAVLASGDTLNYALGIFVGPHRGALTFSHSGGDPGYSAYLLNFPRTGSGVAVLCNTSGGANPTALAEAAAEVYFGAQLAPVPAPAPQVPKAAVSGLEGTYWNDSTEATSRLATDSGGAVWITGNNTTRLRGTGDVWQLGNGAATLRRRGDGTLLYRAGTGESSVYRRVEPALPNAAAAAALAGRYASDELGVIWELRAAGDTLTLVRRKFPSSRLVPVFRDTYTAAEALGSVTLRVVRDARGRVAGFTAGSGRVRHLRFDRVTSPRP